MKRHLSQRTLFLGLILIFVLLMPAYAASKIPQNVSDAINSITEDDGIGIINELASDAYGGRMTGSPGQWLAAHLVASRFKDAGLTPYGGLGSYHQNFNLATNRITGTPILEVKTSDLGYTKYEFGTNFICRGFSGTGDIRGEIVFCGYGVTEDNYDDYANVDVEGKIVLILPSTPLKSAKDRHKVTKWDNVGSKVNNAIDHGAIGVIMIRSNKNGKLGKLVCSVMWGDHKHQPDIPAIVIDRFVAADIFKKSKQDLPLLQGFILADKKPMSFNTGTRARIKVDSAFNPNTPTSNVVGLLEGSHPRLKNEYIILGAHMDHVGTQGNEIMYPGANDNASGTASLLEIVEGFKTAGLRPKRSIIFVAFTGEEMGLKGSSYFVDHLPIEKNKIKCMINLDMMGQGKGTLNVFSKQYPDITAKAKKANKNLYNLAMPVIQSGFGSDHASFVRADIPAAMFLTGGANDYPVYHTHYHYREWIINKELWKQATSTALLAVWYLANE